MTRVHGTEGQFSYEQVAVALRQARGRMLLDSAVDALLDSVLQFGTLEDGLLTAQQHGTLADAYAKLHALAEELSVQPLLPAEAPPSHPPRFHDDVGVEALS